LKIRGREFSACGLFLIIYGAKGAEPARVGLEPGGDVDLVDFSILGLTWLLEEQEAGYDPNCDISLPADGVIDVKNFKIFTDNWLAGL